MARLDAERMDLDEAAAQLGLQASFLQWALNAGLLAGERDGDGRWYLPRQAFETGGEAHAPEERPAAGGVSAGSGQAEVAPPAAARRAAPDPVAPLAKSADELVQHLRQEVAYLRRLIEERDHSLAAKDRLIADLAASLARLGEAALDRLPRDT